MFYFMNGDADQTLIIKHEILMKSYFQKNEWLKLRSIMKMGLKYLEGDNCQSILHTCGSLISHFCLLT